MQKNVPRNACGSRSDCCKTMISVDLCESASCWLYTILYIMRVRKQFIIIYYNIYGCRRCRRPKILHIKKITQWGGGDVVVRFKIS